MDQKEKPRKKKEFKKTFDEWKGKPPRKKSQTKSKVKHPKSWYQDPED